jgi:7-cyano-7-deazaguanine synthase in queuosine biosynthesis
MSINKYYDTHTKEIIGEEEICEIKAAINPPNKNLLIWSGGLDSTAILLDNIRKGIHVDLCYIDIENNSPKSEAELGAREIIKTIIKNKYYPKYFYNSYERRLNHGLINCGSLANFFQPALWITSLIYGYNKDWNYQSIVFGYIKGDCFWHIKHEFESLYKLFPKLVCLDEFKWPDLNYPLEWFTKEQILNDYYLIDDMGKEILNYIWTCEKPNRKGFDYDNRNENLALTPCESCEPCKKLKELKNKQENKKQNIDCEVKIARNDEIMTGE